MSCRPAAINLSNRVIFFSPQSRADCASEHQHAPPQRSVRGVPLRNRQNSRDSPCPAWLRNMGKRWTWGLWGLLEPGLWSCQPVSHERMGYFILGILLGCVCAEFAIILPHKQQSGLGDSMEHLLESNFIHLGNSDGATISICKACLHTIGTVQWEADLDRPENEHQWDSETLEYLRKRPSATHE